MTRLLITVSHYLSYLQGTHSGPRITRSGCAKGLEMVEYRGAWVSQSGVEPGTNP